MVNVPLIDKQSPPERDRRERRKERVPQKTAKRVLVVSSQIP